MKIKAFVCLLALILALAASSFAAPVATVLLTWTASTTTSPTVTYQVFRETAPGTCTSTTSGAGPSCLLLNQQPLAATTYTDLNVPATATLYYVVRSINANGKSGYSNEVKVTFTPIPPPAAPTSLACTGTPAAGEQITVNCQ
jgi:hypothetical protein